MIKELERNQAIRTPAGILTCLEGVLWVTWKGSGDVVLRKGDSVRLPMGARPVAEAVGGPARVLPLARRLLL